MKVKFNKKKRSDYEIIYDILNALKDGPIPKTRLIYRAGLTYLTATRYIPYLEKQNLIKKEGDLYHLTEKGKEVRSLLEVYKAKASEIKEIVQKLEQELGPMDEEEK
ncbi:winged helix-turn-helix domain-containing protein [Sulfurisphaera javensis]|uniref:Winged helix-turn-helix domain-containing protein n=1 Tax=Sulfurisphaera javensis TaxID=2049879 RepID=A0AAT9GV03_9CREN